MTYPRKINSILDPGSAPEIKTFNRYSRILQLFVKSGLPFEAPIFRFPAQEQIGGDFKIPSLIYYDCRGAVKAVGAEALRGVINVRAADEKWTKAEWLVSLQFKFRCQERQLKARQVQAPSKYQSRCLST